MSIHFNNFLKLKNKEIQKFIYIFINYNLQIHGENEIKKLSNSLNKLK